MEYLWIEGKSDAKEDSIPVDIVSMAIIWYMYDGCAPPTAEYGDPGCRRTGSVCSSHSGKMAQGLTYSGKYARYPYIHHPPSATIIPNIQKNTTTTTTCNAGLRDKMVPLRQVKGNRVHLSPP